MKEQQQQQAVYDRARKILGSLPQLEVPLDQVTATALVVAAALMAHTGATQEITREQWLASCVSAFDAAREILKK